MNIFKGLGLFGKYNSILYVVMTIIIIGMMMLVW